MAILSHSLLAIIGLLSTVSTVSGHGQISSPPRRSPGSAMKAACGQQVYSNQASDMYGNIQGELQVAATQADYNEAECDIWLCKGYKYADNTANVQSYTGGQVIPITVDIRAPHTGTCNVSIVDTASNTMLSTELIHFDVYASTATTLPANNTNFEITMPSDLGGKCATAGACVIQWYWFAHSIDQTYASCIDFIVPGGSAAGGAGASSATVSSNSKNRTGSPHPFPNATTIHTSYVSASTGGARPAASAPPPAGSDGVRVPPMMPAGTSLKEFIARKLRPVKQSS